MRVLHRGHGFAAIFSLLAVTACVESSPDVETVDVDPESSCFFRGHYERETQLSADTNDYLGDRVFAAARGYKLGLRSGSFYSRYAGTVAIETTKPCDEAVVQLKVYFEELAATAPSDAVATQVRSLNETWAPIEPRQYENLDPKY